MAVIGKAAALAAIIATAPAHGAEIPVVVAGGELDPAFSGADVYLKDPKPATAPPGRACAAAREYVELVNAGRYANVAALFADDAVILEPMRATARGIGEIRHFYESRIGAMRPQVVAVAYVGNDRDCMVELAARRELQGRMRYTLVSVDHFTLGKGGKVARMVAFARPPRAQ